MFKMKSFVIKSASKDASDDVCEDTSYINFSLCLNVGLYSNSLQVTK